MPSLPAALASGPLVLDGGLATELEARGEELGGGLWSAALLDRAPEAVVGAHLAFYRAGARVATTASYQASFAGFARAGAGRAEAARLMARSVALAAEARRRAGRADLLVVASVGPYGAARADGSEYTGDYDLDVAGLRRFHRDRLEVLAAAGPDALAVETLPCLAEVEAVLAELDRLGGPPAWLSLTCAGGRTRRGEDPAEAFAMARDSAAVVAVGVNCTDPTEVAAVLPAAAAAGRPVLVYPNSGERWDPAARRWRGRPTLRPELAAGWLAAGVAGVGGCCRVGPDQIRELAALVTGSGAATAPAAPATPRPGRPAPPGSGRPTPPPRPARRR